MGKIHKFTHSHTHSVNLIISEYINSVGNKNIPGLYQAEEGLYGAHVGCGDDRASAGGGTLKARF